MENSTWETSYNLKCYDHNIPMSGNCAGLQLGIGD